ncbi:hypothetical protein PG985_013216 [Apiospora marii]|uniref:uncharacterized protein n=1 Tax=Apiospora marii TaxID=335849 RepID=UPI00312E16ED
MQSGSSNGSSLVDWRIATEFLPGGSHLHYGQGSSIELWQRPENSFLGEGTYGEVWKEQCVSSPQGEGKVRAVKKIPKGRQKVTERELRAMAAFSTPSDPHFLEYRRYLVQLYGWFENDSDIFISMELVPRGSLEDHIKGRSLSEPEVAIITVQISRALRLIHGTGFAHRDLKPGNILVAKTAPYWWVKVADFGIAKSTQGTQLNTLGRGTFTYMAPEVFAATNPYSLAYSVAVDIWSLGALAFCLIVGRPPFQNPQEAWRFTEGFFPFPGEALSQFRAEVFDLIFLAMSGNPARRPTAMGLLGHPWLQPYGIDVDRICEGLICSPPSATDFTASQGHSWNEMASNPWTEPAQAPQISSTIQPYIMAPRLPSRRSRLAAALISQVMGSFK